MELTRLLFGRIEKFNPRLNAYITVCEEQALRMAAQAEAELASPSKTKKDRGPLHGIPISLKDNIYTQEIRTTGGSKILKDFVPLHDAPLVTALKEAGAVILGKTNMHEFAYGVSNDNPHFGAVRNPWDIERISGGSSGGSAAAVAAGLCFGSIGTDTGGSIRVPASLCGVVGLKPGIGRVNAEDVIPLSPTLDFVGPLARSPEDAALLLDAIFVRGRNEAKLLPGKITSSRGRRPRLGIPKKFFLEILDPEVQSAFQDALGVLKKRGARMKEVSLPLIEKSEDAGNVIAWAEATFYHQQAGWFPERAAEYGKDVRERLGMGTKVSAVSYLQARELREKFKAALRELFEAYDLDALAVPTTAITAPRIGEDSVTLNGSAHPTRALLLRLNRPANLAGVPAISVPCGLTKSGLPVGFQFITECNHEPLLIEIAREFEREFPFQAPSSLSAPGPA